MFSFGENINVIDVVSASIDWLPIICQVLGNKPSLSWCSTVSSTGISYSRPQRKSWILSIWTLWFVYEKNITEWMETFPLQITPVIGKFFVIVSFILPLSNIFQPALFMSLEPPEPSKPLLCTGPFQYWRFTSHTLPSKPYLLQTKYI